MGIIDSLSAGFRLVARHLWLILVPVLLDLLLWLAPQFSVAPILAGAADAYAALVNQAVAQTGDQAATLGDIPQLATATADSLRDFGQFFNLLSATVSSSLLHVPSLVASWALPPAAGGVIEIASPWAALGLWLLFALVGLFVGVLFLELLTVVLPLGASPKPLNAGALLRSTGRHGLRVLGFVLLLGALLLVLMVPYSLLLGLLLLFLPWLATGIAAVTFGIFVMLFLYLYFVTAAIVVDDRTVMEAIRASYALVRANLLRVFGFALLINLISLGIGFLLNDLAGFQPVGTVVAILVNAFIGTGLAMALLVFYRSRLLVAAQAGQPVNLEP